MKKIRVLVADDSAVLRRLISTVIDGEADMEVVGTAENGRTAVEQAKALRPDVITLDVEMPILDGLGALKEIRAIQPTTPIIMFSTLTEQGSATTLEALSHGASDFVAKPSGEGGLGRSIERIRAELTPRIRSLSRHARTITSSNRAEAPAIAKPHQARPPRTNSRIDCVVFAVSTGGPRALEQVIPQIPKGLGVPLFMVQHMPASFTGLLAKRLNTVAQIEIIEATGSHPVQPDKLYLAPGDHHLIVERKGAAVFTALNEGPPERSCRPAADVLFRSAAAVYGSGVLAVVLTGMGDDGTLGAEAIVKANGRVIAQDKATSVVWGMPGSVVQAGLTDCELPLAGIIAEIVQRIQAGNGAFAASRALRTAS